MHTTTQNTRLPKGMGMWGLYLLWQVAPGLKIKGVKRWFVLYSGVCANMCHRHVMSNADEMMIIIVDDG